MGSQVLAANLPQFFEMHAGISAVLSRSKNVGWNVSNAASHTTRHTRAPRPALLLKQHSPDRKTSSCLLQPSAHRSATKNNRKHG